MRKRRERHQGAAQRSHLAQVVRRRRKRAAMAYAFHVGPHLQSARMATRARLREMYQDRVVLDKLEGRELGSVARALYREEEKRKREKRLAKGGAR